MLVKRGAAGIPRPKAQRLPAMIAYYNLSSEGVMEVKEAATRREKNKVWVFPTISADLFFVPTAR